MLFSDIGVYNGIVKVPHVNLDQLVTFYFVARERSLTRAAEKLCVTVPAVAKQMKSLEAFFGTKLIAVRQKKVFLTSTGTLLFPHAEEVYFSALNAESSLLSAKDNLRVGVSFALTCRVLPILDKFKEVCPSICVILKEGSSTQLLSELLEFQHDICIVVTPETVSSELQVVRVPKPNKMLLVADPQSPLAKKEQVDWEDLNDYPLVLHEGSLTRELILDDLQSRGVHPRIVGSLDSTEVLKELVRKGFGATFTLLWNVAGELTTEKLKIIPMKDDGGVEVWIDIVTHKRVIQSPASKAFLGLAGTELGCAFDPE